MRHCYQVQIVFLQAVTARGCVLQINNWCGVLTVSSSSSGRLCLIIFTIISLNYPVSAPSLVPRSTPQAASLYSTNCFPRPGPEFHQHSPVRHWSPAPSPQTGSRHQTVVLLTDLCFHVWRDLSHNRTWVQLSKLPGCWGPNNYFN